MIQWASKPLAHFLIGKKMKENTIPIWEKITLTIDEASSYSNIGKNKIYELINDPNCNFALRVGRKQLIKRKAFDDFISQSKYI